LVQTAAQDPSASINIQEMEKAPTMSWCSGEMMLHVLDGQGLNPHRRIIFMLF
jgi:hypothetical protein